ncbi:MAG: hypothetical protein ACRCXX_13760 [Cetobacterium sp.]|uniref:hypothetical protein n=1 Tax=Cetobacterium sp. TaxID=2071632 RepID=UPI003F372EDC
MVNKIGRHNREWTTLDLEKLCALKDEQPKKVAKLLGKTIGAINQEKFRRGLTTPRPRMTSADKEYIITLKCLGLSFQEVADVVKKPYQTVYSVWKRR